MQNLMVESIGIGGLCKERIGSRPHPHIAGFFQLNFRKDHHPCPTIGLLKKRAELKAGFQGQKQFRDHKFRLQAGDQTARLAAVGCFVNRPASLPQKLRDR